MAIALPPLLDDRIIAWRRSIYGVALTGQPHTCYPREVDEASVRGYDLSSVWCVRAATKCQFLPKMNKVMHKAKDPKKMN